MFKNILLSIIIIPTFLFSSKINILYDEQSDGSIDSSSIWIIKMLNEAGDKNSIEVKFEGAPWARALELLKAGVADGLINASYKKSRVKYAVYPFKNGKLDLNKSLKAPAYYLYKHKDHPLNFDGKNLLHANGEISAIPSYAVVDDLKILNANLVYGINPNFNLNNVLHKKNIATALLESEAEPIIDANLQMKESIVKISTPIRKKEYFLIYSKKYYNSNQEIANKLWDTIEVLKNSDKYKKEK